MAARRLPLSAPVARLLAEGLAARRTDRTLTDQEQVQAVAGPLVLRLSAATDPGLAAGFGRFLLVLSHETDWRFPHAIIHIGDAPRAAAAGYRAAAWLLGVRGDAPRPPPGVAVGVGHVVAGARVPLPLAVALGDVEAAGGEVLSTSVLEHPSFFPQGALLVAARGPGADAVARQGGAEHGAATGPRTWVFVLPR